MRKLGCSRAPAASSSRLASEPPSPAGRARSRRAPARACRAPAPGPRRCAARCCAPRTGWWERAPLATASRKPKSAASTATPLASCAARKRISCSASAAAGTQLLGGARLHRAARARQHCGQRHSLRDDHQADDQHEKPFAETAHEIRSKCCAIVRATPGIPARIRSAGMRPPARATVAPDARLSLLLRAARGCARLVHAASRAAATLVINVQTADGQPLAGAVVTARPLRRRRRARTPRCTP